MGAPWTGGCRKDVGYINISVIRDERRKAPDAGVGAFAARAEMEKVGGATSRPFGRLTFCVVV
ncbi:hypothetical protein FH063_003962 [Azospirillum argentinense]|uniref:Uncharacterized protein n=1 Tax=Azospirillum argentinense TaxID=2970906 RepID=A0A5B0KYB3_9PROT|nr:hypothetical protein FH063_003962 [Azospirillum argentinense]